MVTEIRENPPSPEELRVATQMIGIYRGWDLVDEYLDKANDIKPTEIDVAGPNFPTIPVRSRQDARDQLVIVRDSIVPSTPYLEFARDSAIASITHVDALNGQQIELNEYAQKMIGREPKMIDKDDIIRQKIARDEAFAGTGQQPTLENYNKYFNKDKLQPEEVVSQFTEGVRKSLPIVATAVGLSHLLPLEYELKMEPMETTAQSFRMTYRLEGPKVVVNINPEIRWIKGRPEELSYHEIAGHLLAYSSCKKNIEDGLINPGYGVIQIPNPISWADEALCCDLPFFIPELYDTLTVEGKFMAESYLLQRMVMNNVHIMANNGTPDEQIKEFILEYLPYEPPNRVANYINNRRNNVYNRAYQLTYSDGTYYFAKVAKELGPEKCILLLKAFYHHPMTPNQVEALIVTLKAA